MSYVGCISRASFILWKWIRAPGPEGLGKPSLPFPWECNGRLIYLGATDVTVSGKNKDLNIYKGRVMNEAEEEVVVEKKGCCKPAVAASPSVQLGQTHPAQAGDA